MSGVDWTDAECRQPGIDASIFFPERGGDNGRAAKRICRRCPIQQQCGEYVMELERRIGEYGRHGVFAGLTPGERSRLAKGLR